MFWEKFSAICLERNTTPTAIVSELGLARGSVTKWKSGSSPNSKTVSKIADHLGVNVGDLLGCASEPSDITPEEKEALELIKMLTEDEVKQARDYLAFLVSKRKK